LYFSYENDDGNSLVRM